MRGGKERLHHKGVPFSTATTDLAPTPQDDVSPLTSHRSLPNNLPLHDNRQFTPTDLDAAGIASQRKSGNLSTDAVGETFEAVTSATNADMPSSEKTPDDLADGQEQSKKKKRKRRKKETEVADMSFTSHQRELAQNESIDYAPFRSKPYQLALDPKDLETVTALGGTDGIIRGLGTHPEHGLTTIPLYADASYSHDSEKQDLELGGNILLTEPSGEVGVPSEEKDHVPYSGTMDDRKRIYGENVLPVRTSKTLLQLMVVALKDKVLVCSCASSQYYHNAYHPPLDPAINCGHRFSGFGSLPRLWYP
jgi:Ca2+-transporting ATPase